MPFLLNMSLLDSMSNDSDISMSMVGDDAHLA